MVRDPPVTFEEASQVIAEHWHSKSVKVSSTASGYEPDNAVTGDNAMTDITEAANGVLPGAREEDEHANEIARASGTMIVGGEVENPYLSADQKSPVLETRGEIEDDDDDDFIVDEDDDDFIVDEDDEDDEDGDPADDPSPETGNDEIVGDPGNDE